MKKIISILSLFISIVSFSQKIKVLNFGTFHMDGTSDARKIEFDAESKQSKNETMKIAKMISKFRPTVICVEVEPSENEKLNLDYSQFLNTPNFKSNYNSEISLIAYEVGKLCGVKKLYGIDEQKVRDYNYNIGNELKNQVDSLTYKHIYNKTILELDKIDKLSTIDKLKWYNSKKGYDTLININADVLNYVSTRYKSEGADEASIFYHRNLIIFSNLNQIPLKNTDRVFIIMGGAHAAFLNDFFSRSPKYQSVNVLEYLK